jgi:hypothetical protein
MEFVGWISFQPCNYLVAALQNVPVEAGLALLQNQRQVEGPRVPTEKGVPLQGAACIHFERKGPG